MLDGFAPLAHLFRMLVEPPLDGLEDGFGLRAPLQIRQTFRVQRQPVPEFLTQRLQGAWSQRLFPGAR